MVALNSDHYRQSSLYAAESNKEVEFALGKNARSIDNIDYVVYNIIYARRNKPGVKNSCNCVSLIFMTAKAALGGS